MQPGHRPAHLEPTVGVTTDASSPLGAGRIATCTALCLLALYALLTPATIGPLGALMLLTLAVGSGKALGVPLAAHSGGDLPGSRAAARE